MEAPPAPLDSMAGPTFLRHLVQGGIRVVALSIHSLRLGGVAAREHLPGSERQQCRNGHGWAYPCDQARESRGMLRVIQLHSWGSDYLPVIMLCRGAGHLARRLLLRGR